MQVEVLKILSPQSTPDCQTKMLGLEGPVETRVQGGVTLLVEGQQQAQFRAQ